MIHAMSKEYGVLPSRLLREGDTFDMMVFDVINTIKDYHERKNNKEGNVPTYSEEALQNAIGSMSK